MSDSYILLLAQLSRPVDAEFDLLQTLCVQLAGKIEGEHCPVRCVLMISSQTGILWVKGISSSEYMVSKGVEFDGMSIKFEFPRNQPSFLVEIAPKKKGIVLNLKKFDEVFESLKDSFDGAECLQVSDHRIVVKFANPEEAVKHCDSFIEPMNEDNTVMVTSRVLLIKEHVVMRVNYVNGDQPFHRVSADQMEKSGQTMASFLYSKFSHFKDRPVILSINSLPPEYAIIKADCEGKLTEEVYIAGATHFDYRLLHNSPPISTLYHPDSSLIFRTHLENRIRKTTAGVVVEDVPVSPNPPSCGPPALPPAAASAIPSSMRLPPNLSHAGASSTAVAAASAALPLSSTTTVTTATTTALTVTPPSSSNTTPMSTTAHIFWDYGSCSVPHEICSPDDIDTTMIASITNNIRSTIDKYAQYKKDIGNPVKITNFHKYIFAPQGSSFTSIHSIPSTWNSFTKNDYKIHHYSKKCSSEQLLRKVVENEYTSRHSSDTKLIYCFITNNSEINSIASYLKLHDQHDILLIHANTTSSGSIISNLMRKQYLWSSILEDIVFIPKNNNKNKKERTPKNDRTGSSSNSSSQKESASSSMKVKDKVQEVMKGKRELEPGEELEDCELTNTGSTGGGGSEAEFFMPPGRDLVPWSAGDDTASGAFGCFGIEEDPELHRGSAAGRKKSGDMVPALSAFSSDSADSHSTGTGTESQSHRSGAPNTSSNTTSQENMTAMKLDLKFPSVATYMKRLIFWRKEQDKAAGVNTSYSYLLGENITDYSTELSLACNIRIDINPKLKKFILHISGSCSKLVTKRYNNIRSMLEEILKIRQFHNFQGWTSEHRNAIIGSDVLTNQEKTTKACVLFHHSNNTTIAEIVALKQIMHNSLLKFIQKIKPKENMIKIPTAFISWYDEKRWEKMRLAYMIKTEIRDIKDGKTIKSFKTGYITPENADEEVNLKIWGFMPKFMEKAIEHIKRNEEREEIIPVVWVDDGVAGVVNAALAVAEGTAAPGGAGSKGKEKVSPVSGVSGRTVTVAATTPTGAGTTAAVISAPTASSITAALREKSATVTTTATTAPTTTAEGSKDRSSESTTADSAGNYHCTHAFAERAAGRFFFAFYATFREYLVKRFAVNIDELKYKEQLAALESDIEVNNATTGTTTGTTATTSSDSIKISFYTKSIKNLEAAKQYLHQINMAVLATHQVFFPRVSTRKYKEIYNTLAAQSQKMYQLRMKSTQTATINVTTSLPQDPLTVPGFIHIYSNPILLQVSTKVKFPLDITITICGPLSSLTTHSVSDGIKLAFESIPCEFSIATVNVPSSHYMKRQLMVRSEREDLTKKFNLVALHWEESPGMSTISVTTAKVWAYSKAGLKSFLYELMRPDQVGANATLVGEDKLGVLPVECVGAVGGSGSGAVLKQAAAQPVPLPFNPQQQPVPLNSTPQPVAVPLNPTPQQGSEPLNPTPQQGPMSFNSQQQPGPMPFNPQQQPGQMPFNPQQQPGPMPFNPQYQPGPMPFNPQYQSGPMPFNPQYQPPMRPSAYPNGMNGMPPPPGSPYLSGSGPGTGAPPPMGIRGDSPMQAGKSKAPSAKGRPSVDLSKLPPGPRPACGPKAVKAVICLPDLSLRHVMLGEPLKSKLNDVLERMLKMGAHIAYPYKDRTNPHACCELEGSTGAVASASAELKEFLEKAARSLRCVQIVMNMEQFNYYTNGGEGIGSGSNPMALELQTNYGVHCIFNPPPTSIREAGCIFDMRFSSELIRRSHLDPLAVAEDLPVSLKSLGKVDTEMISVSVFNCFSQRSVEIAIISSNSSESGWTWGVTNLLLLVGNNTLGFNAMETDLLNRGEVLVHTDRNTNRTILRIKPNHQASGVNFQAAVLTNALLKCLQKANELGLKGLAVSAPTDIDVFPELNPEMVRSLTVEAVVEFAKKCRSYLRFTKIVCIEQGSNVATMAAQLEELAAKSTSAPIAALERRLEPTQRDRMVRTMVVLLERQELEVAAETAPQKPMYDPRNPYQQLPPPRPEQRSRVSLQTCNVPLPPTMFTALPSYERQKGFRTFLVKGLLSSVVKAVDQIRAKLATPKIDNLPINMEEFF